MAGTVVIAVMVEAIVNDTRMEEKKTKRKVALLRRVRADINIERASFEKPKGLYLRLHHRRI